MTILFLEDWDLYPDAIPDYKTKNKSFLRFAALLKKMNVDNHLWPLALMNPELQGVDPHDPNLTLEQMAMVGLEVKSNPFYFARECIRVPGGTPDDPISFIANRGNMALFWLFLNHITQILIQIRQTGKSFSTDCLATWVINYASTQSTFNLLTKDDGLRATNLERLKDIERELPYYLRMRRKGDVGNTEEIHISRVRNKYKGHLPNKSAKMALNVGRGMTSPTTQVDEAAFFYNISISLPAALAAGTAARAIAKRKGEPYGIILTTTAGKKDDRDGKYMYNMVQEAAVWNEKFYDALNLAMLEDIVRKSGSGPNGELLVNCTFNHQQLGYTDEWLREAVLTARAKGEDADRDFGNVWTSGSQSSPLPIELAEIIRESEVKDHFGEICLPAAYIVRWYIPEDKIASQMASEMHIIGLDTSDGGGGDDLALYIRSSKTGETIAVANVNETNLIAYAEWIANFMFKYEKTVLIPERRSTGAMIIDYLLLLLPSKGIDPFKRIYNKVVQEKDEFPERFELINKPMYLRPANIYVDLKKTFGFATSASGATSRSELYSTTLISAAKMTGNSVKDTKLINQILGLVNKNGRVDHGDGEHDDLCFTGSTLVRTITGNRPIKDIRVGDLVLTRQGYKPIIAIFVNERNVITKYGITGTPSHPFITPEGEIPFENLTLNTKVYVWNEKRSDIMIKTIIDTLSLKDLSIEIISIGMIKIMNLLPLCIGRYMKIITDLYQKVSRYIIKMATLVITQLRISNVYQPETTEENTQQLKKPEINSELMLKKDNLSLNGVKRIPIWLESVQKRTVMKVKDWKNGVKRILKKLPQSPSKQVNYQPRSELKKESTLQPILINGGMKIPNWLERCLDKMVFKTPLFKIGIKKIQEKLKAGLLNGVKRTLIWLESMPEPQVKNQLKQELKKDLVYNLTVAECHEYFVEDILVHNCIAFLLSFWFLVSGKHLSFYGINNRDILVNNRENQKNNDPLTLYESRYQSMLKSLVEKLIQDLKVSSDEFIARKLENQLIHYSGQMTVADRATLSVDELIQKTREARNGRARYNY